MFHILNIKDFGRCIDWLLLASQSLYRISGHPEVFTAIILIIIIRRIRITSKEKLTLFFVCFFCASAMIFNSTIISNNSFYRAELASFLSPAVGQVESKWKLCYNALSDGWEPKIFHRNCDNKYHTITIIEKRPFIFGGYTDIPWGNHQNSYLCSISVKSKMLEYVFFIFLLLLLSLLLFLFIYFFFE